MAPKGLLERLAAGPVVVAEGYLFELERRGYLKAGPFVPEVVLDHPEALRELHREFLRAGSDVIVAFTYYGHRDKLRVIGRENDLEALNVNAVRIAKEVAAEGDALVAGNVCNTWVYDPNDKATWDVVREMYDEQIGWAAREGVDFIIAETIGHLGEAEIALEVIKKYNLPAVINLFAIDHQSLEGIDWIECVKKLEAKGADVVGLNCGRGPETMLPLLKEIRKAVKCHVSALPVPYNTTCDCISFLQLKNREGKSAFPLSLECQVLTRQDMGKFAKDAYDIGVNFIGICCGGAPYHVRHMAEALGRRPPASKYSADLSLHGNLGRKGVKKEHETKYDKLWRAAEE